MRRRVVMVGIGSLVAGVSTYVLNVVAARTMPVDQTTKLLTDLAVLFFFYGITAAVTTEFTRSIAVASRTGVANGPRASNVCFGIAVAASAALAFSWPWWGNLPGTSVGLPVMSLMAAGVFGFVVHSALCGVLAGSDRWGHMALLVGAEGSGRVVFAFVVVAIGVSSDRYLTAVVGAAFVWIAFVILSPTVRQSFGASMDAPLGIQVPRFAAAFVAQASSAALTVSFPVLLSLTTPAAKYSASAPLLLGIAITRAPLMVPLTTYQSMIVAHFAQAEGRVGWRLLELAGAILGLGTVAATFAWAFGPAIMAWLVSPEYTIDGTVLAGLMMAAACLALVTITGAVSQARSLHRWFLGGWLISLAVTVSLLFLPLPLESRAVVSLLAGPLVGSLVHAAAVVGAERRRPAVVKPSDVR